MTAPPRALTIAGSDSGGGAGIQADLKTFLGCGVHGMSAVTAITVQNSLGVTGVHEVPAQVVADQIESVVTDIGVDATKTGMLASAPIIEAVAATVRRLRVGPLIVDPVCASQHGDPLIRPDAVEALRDQLLPLADLTTPNLGEVKLLTGIAVRDRAGQQDAARALYELGCRRVLVKGGHLPADQPAIDLLFDGAEFRELTAARLPSAHTHGTGDTLAAATAAGLARGLDLLAALAEAKRYVTAAIADGYPLGTGVGPVGHFWRLSSRS
ncbi:MAG TPA: bifunctional hydroxymethylpyrimidine kinase/phosphomethylpyrimidine kinase [Pseudonocardia sp.]|nr:bifunctional hydroxymethylpyrimidine kinase/phosphomethylpyrimidine kinase [Pseudonocardia sp.]